MRKLLIKEIKNQNSVSLSEAEQFLEIQTILNPIQTLNWKDFMYMPNVNFRIGHIGNEIWLKYYVNESYVRAKETKINGSVHKDSCVEFFILLGGDNYYNFEFNCIGITHLSWGPDRYHRKFIDPTVIKRIDAKSTLGNQPFENRKGNFDWELMIRIPLGCFIYDNLKTFKGLRAMANFYKCGDELPKQHYLTWNPVKTDIPDYHQSKYFGLVLFE